MVQSHGEIHRCLVKLLELEEMGTIVNLLNVFAEAFKVPDPVPPESSDESMPEETRPARLCRYQHTKST